MKYELGFFASAAATVFCVVKLFTGTNREPSIDASKLEKREGVFITE